MTLTSISTWTLTFNFTSSLILTLTLTLLGSAALPSFPQPCTCCGGCGEEDVTEGKGDEDESRNSVEVVFNRKYIHYG